MGKDLRQVANEIKNSGVQCNCDLDNWQPERSTGHSCVCRIHKRVMAMKYRPHNIKPTKTKNFLSPGDKVLMNDGSFLTVKSLEFNDFVAVECAEYIPKKNIKMIYA